VSFLNQWDIEQQTAVADAALKKQKPSAGASGPHNYVFKKTIE
jgi:hypothetical protein